MQLKKIYFDAYKSLLNKELELTDACIGFVGINESGKSNVLSAIEVLNPQNKLNASDTPRMARTKNPQIRFEFEPSEVEEKTIRDMIVKWRGQNNVDTRDILPAKFTICYHVIFNPTTKEENRFFTIKGVQLPRNVHLLKINALTGSYLFKRDGKYISLSSAVLINEDELKYNEGLFGKSKNLSELELKISTVEAGIEQLKAATTPVPSAVVVPAVPVVVSTSGEQPQSVLENKEKLPELKSEPINPELEQKVKELRQLVFLKTELEAQIGEFDIQGRIIEINENIKTIEVSIEETQAATTASEAKITELEKVAAPTEVQVKDLNTARKTLVGLKEKSDTLKYDKERKEFDLLSLKQPLREKYTIDLEELSKILGSVTRAFIEPNLPPVVYWEGKENYTLKGETEFEQILSAKELRDISRPLVNLFRIGLGIQSLDELKTTITEIKNNSTERSRYATRLKKEINDYLKAVWSDYDQEINISLEQDRILIQFYDPARVEASFYHMEERSQGCQTFISFLLTIGAEAKTGVIKNTVLLLDEPETHLHPSGVRFMLQELITAAKNGNKVLFATHSIFMIDRENYNRHIILKKEREETTIQPSRSDQIGFFMQEEVLYSTLDIDLNKDFDSTNRFNFVFEGAGDAEIFEKFYNKFLKERPFDSKTTSFYQGGKCSSIMKYFTYKPIQLGAKWIFIIDNDEPANKLKAFLEGKYKEYIDKYVYIFQYTLKGQGVELEDMLPNGLMQTVMANAVKELEPITTGTINIQAVVKADSLFKDYCAELSAKLKEKDKLKPLVKQILNLHLYKEMNQITTKEAFDEKFNNYSTWGASVIQKLNNPIVENKDGKK